MDVGLGQQLDVGLGQQLDVGLGQQLDFGLGQQLEWSWERVVHYHRGDSCLVGPTGVEEPVVPCYSPAHKKHQTRGQMPP